MNLEMEKVVKKFSMKAYRDRPSPWKFRSGFERLAAMAVSCQPQGKARNN